MTLTVSLTLTNQPEDIVRELEKRTPSIDKLVEQATAVILNRIRTRFLAEQDPDGKPWVPSISGKRRRASGGTGTLFDTGTLFHSIGAVKTRDGERIVTFDQSQAPYGKDHQLGEGGQLKRAFIGINNDDAAVVTAVLKRALNR